MWLIPALFIFGNYWIWKILQHNTVLGILLILTSFLVYNCLENKKVKLILIVSVLLLCLLQYKTSQTTSLFALSDTQISIQQKRMNEYPPIHISLLKKNYWVPVAHWFEEKKISVATYKISKNLSEVIDPNLYFFANHPRERVGVHELEKIPYFFIFFFLYGVLLLISSATKAWYLYSLFIPVLLLSYIGNQNPLGPFVLFPFITSTMAFCFKSLTRKYIKR